MPKIKSSVNVVEVCMVPPSPGSVLPASLPLTFFDILWLRFPPVECLYFYKSSASFDVVVSNLKTTLSVVLQHYLPLAGALVWPENAPKPYIETVTGDGVLLTVAESNNGKFEDLVSDGMLREVRVFHPLVPELGVTERRAAVVALQVTSFGSDGFCIGITTHHAILDGRSATSFVKMWASVCKSLVVGSVFPTDDDQDQSRMPFYDRSVVLDPAGLEGIYLTDWLAVGGPNNTTLKFYPPKIPHNLFRGTLKLNPQNIEKLKQLVMNRQNPTHPPAHISTFTVAMAYTWVCTAMADDSILPNDEMKFFMSVDARQRLNPPLPGNYFGNCVVGRSTAVERAKLVAEDAVVTAVESISKAIKSLEHEGALNGAENWATTLTQALGDHSNRKMLSIAGSPRFEVYGVDFGWGTPKKVEVVSIDGTGAVCICDGRDGGVELAWTAKRDIMETFAAAFSKGLQKL